MNGIPAASAVVRVISSVIDVMVMGRNSVASVLVAARSMLRAEHAAAQDISEAKYAIHAKEQGLSQRPAKIVLEQAGLYAADAEAAELNGARYVTAKVEKIGRSLVQFAVGQGIGISEKGNRHN